jgi:putative transposase
MNSAAIIPLEAGNYYHIYNRGNNSGRIFFSDRNYQYFLDKYRFYVGPYVQTVAYCLLPNHYHLLVKIRPLVTPGCLADLVSDQFRKMFIGYSMAINKQEGRTGSLFQKNFRRKKINETSYLLNAIHYINHNPLRHGMLKDMDTYPWNSYRSHLEDRDSLIDQNEVTSLFGDLRRYADFHHRKPAAKNESFWVIED